MRFIKTKLGVVEAKKLHVSQSALFAHPTGAEKPIYIGRIAGSKGKEFAVGIADGPGKMFFREGVIGKQAAITTLIEHAISRGKFKQADLPQEKPSAAKAKPVKAPKEAKVVKEPKAPKEPKVKAAKKAAKAKPIDPTEVQAVHDQLAAVLNA